MCNEGCFQAARSARPRFSESRACHRQRPRRHGRPGKEAVTLTVRSLPLPRRRYGGRDRHGSWTGSRFRVAGDCGQPRSPATDLLPRVGFLGYGASGRLAWCSRQEPEVGGQYGNWPAMTASRKYNGRRPHRGRHLCPPRSDRPVADLSLKRIQRRPVLGGLINEYERAA